MEKKTIHDLGIFGGTKLFKKKRAIGQLFTPPVDDYLKLIKEINKVNSYDVGCLIGLLEENLKTYHKVSHCVTVPNAAIGLTMLMQHFSGTISGEVIMPSFSFRGLPHFSQWANQKPCFCDVDPVTHFIDYHDVEKKINSKTTSILGVCNFNNPGDINKLDLLGKKYNIPVFLDSVYGIGSTYNGKILGGFTQAEVYSLHATKLLNGFEGGYITTNDEELASILRRQLKCTLPHHRSYGHQSEDYNIGFNSTLNPFHAAMAILSLENIDRIIEKNKSRFFKYCNVIENISGLSVLPYLDCESEKRSYQLVVVEPDNTIWALSRDQIIEVLIAEGLAISPYYSPPLHKSEHCPQNITKQELPVSEELARKYFQLPVGELVSDNDIHKIGELLNFIYQNGREIESRLNRNIITC